jgi:polysaccharide deacetylase 2 family uncharacterized protein YibQ
MNAKRRTPVGSSRNAAVLSFLAFGLIALGMVVALEFLDFRAGKYSFIFNQVLRLGREQPAGERFQRDLAAMLSGEKIPYDLFRDRAGVAHLKIDLVEPRFAGFARDLLRLVEKHGGLHLLSEVQGMRSQVVYLYQVRFDRRLTHVVLLSKKLPAKAVAAPPAKAPASPGARVPAARAKFSGTPRLAIVIDDIGYADLVADRLRDLGLPLTAAVIPAAPYARSEAQRLHEYGLEAIIHLPMQPQDPANHHPRDQFILVDSSADEIRALLQKAVAAVPFARGVNNHMGSRLTSDPQAMRLVLELIRAQGLFFVDSKTAPSTVAHALALDMGIRTALRDVFLDDVQTYEHAGAQLRRLVELAREKGRALAIGHPFPTTLDALRDAVPWLKKQGIEIVFVSEILE